MSSVALAQRVPVRLRRGLAFDALGTLALNVSTLILGFASTVVLTRALGAGGYGAFAFAFAWAGILSVPAHLGLVPLVVRNVAAYHATSAWGSLHGLLRRCNQIVLASSAVLVVVGAATGLLVAQGHPELLHPYLVGLALVPLISLTSVRQAALSGLGRVVLGRIPETLIAPLLFVVLVVVVSQTVGLSATGATALQVGGFTVAFVLGAWLLRRATPQEVSRATPQYETRAWLSTALPFLVMAGVSVLTTQIGTIVVGAVEGSEAAGMYNVATRTAVFTSFLWLTATYPLGPMIPRLYVKGEHAELERVLVRFGRLTFLATLPLALILVVFAHPVLSVFGGEFTGGVTALRLIALGELAKVASGFASLALLMTAYERGATAVLTAACVLTIVLDLVLVPLWGIEGAAVGSAAGAILASGLVVHLARRQLGMRVSALRLTRVGRLPPAEPGGRS